MQTEIDSKKNWLDQPILKRIHLSPEYLLFGAILIIAIITRFYNLGDRVMSHDENSHVYYSWRLFRGEGFAHDPLMHGPFQFLLIALSFFIFGDNDFTARILAAVLSIATVGFMWNYRRYLGKVGAIIAAFLMLISPYMLYYGRYVRNEAYAAFFGVVTLWAMLKYIESGENRHLYWLTAVTALHFTAKETAFIYTAQALLFLAIYFVYRISHKKWEHEKYRNQFIIFLFLGVIFLAATGIFYLIGGTTEIISATETASPSIPGQGLIPPQYGGNQILPFISLILCVLSLCLSIYFLLRGYSLNRIKEERSFDLLILLGTFVLPQLSALPVRIAGWNIPTNASQIQSLTFTDMVRIGSFFVPLLLLSLLIGLWWNRRQWLINAGIFYTLFIVFYTTLFTNGAGFFTGMVGSLGYWLEQQGVNRGSQPWYYYGLIQIPVYEYLPALGTLLLTIMLLFRKFLFPKKSPIEEENEQDKEGTQTSNQVEEAPVLPLLVFWTFTSLLAYTVAGEKMPWLTVHIAWPMILCAGWFFGRIFESVNWSEFLHKRGWLIVALLIVFLSSLITTLTTIMGTNPPFQGKTLEQLNASTTFLVSLITAIGSGIGLVVLLRIWSLPQVIMVLGLVIFGLLSLLTARTALQAAYLNHNNANELLVYAHSAGGVKTALDQIEEISKRTTDGLALEVAYDNATSYPYWWYLRNYSNARYYGADPTRSLREVSAILVGDENFGNIEPIVGQAYNRFDYIRLWWPNQDYFDLDWERISAALRDPAMRSAIFQIWLNRDYSSYGNVTGKDMSLPNWSPAARMRLYLRKDLVNQLWNYGAAPSTELIQADPYEGKEKILTASLTFGSEGNQPGQFQHPRGIAIAPDGSVYVADTENNRIQQMTSEGEYVRSWGEFGDSSAGSAPGGAFNQPWGIAVAKNGDVYVADTWNHRIQKFNKNGEFITMWGYFGQAEQPTAFWGPRDVALDSEGNVLVTDTGNKRVVVFDAQGNYITQFGGAGYSTGQFDEPVGIAVDSDDNVYVADTWNQRIQVFTRTEDDNYTSSGEWEMYAWYGQSLDNKPYLDVTNEGMVFVTDPEGYRVMQFSKDGEFIQYWGDFGTELTRFGLPVGIAIDENGGVWVSDAGNNRIMKFVVGE